jgi:hypothetical protein
VLGFTPTLGQSRVATISVDEVITINIQSWISIHCDVMIGFNCVSILFILECLVEGGNATNIKTIIFLFLMMYGGLFQNQIVKCLVCLRIDSASTFQEVRSRTCFNKDQQNTLPHWELLYGT